MSRIVLAAALALACAFSASAATLPATPATFLATVSSAAPGDVVELAPGDYGSPIIEAKQFAAPGITIKAGPGVVFGDLIIRKHWQGKPAEGIAVVGGQAKSVTVGGSNRIAIRDMLVTGPLGFRDALDVEITGNEVAGTQAAPIGTGITVMDADRVLIARNHVHHVQVDGIRAVGSADVLNTDGTVKTAKLGINNVRIAYNKVDSFFPPAGAHPDGLQMWSFGKVATNIEIVGNWIDYGEGSGVAQGIFVTDGTYRNVLIKGNAARGTMWNGITISRATGVVIEDNFTQGRDTKSWIRTVANTGIAIKGNWTDAIIHPTTATLPADVDLKVEANTFLAAGDATAFASWLKTHRVGPLAAEPPPVPVDPKDAEIAVLTARVAGLTSELATANAKALDLGARLTEAVTRLTAANDNLALSAAALAAERSRVATLRGALSDISKAAAAAASF